MYSHVNILYWNLKKYQSVKTFFQVINEGPWSKPIYSLYLGKSSLLASLKPMVESLLSP